MKKSIIVLMLIVLLATALLFKQGITGSVVVSLFAAGNFAPVLDPIGNQTAREGSLFTLQVTASDRNNDSMAFSENANFFDFNSPTNTSALINFTPVSSNVGNHSVRITVSDGTYSDFEDVTFTILALTCGDNICSPGESCSSCSIDCGACSSGNASAGSSGSSGSGSGSGSGGGAGAGSAGDTGEGAQAQGDAASSSGAGAQGSGGGGSGSGSGAGGAGGFSGFCEEKWSCNAWGACIDGKQRRECTDENNCRTSLSKPLDERECIPEDEPEKEKKKSEPLSCSDGVQNNGEEDVDCGGPCAPCAIKKFAKIPGLAAAAEIVRVFPTLVVILMGALLGTLTAADKTYVTYLKKKEEFEEYRHHFAAYRPWRRRLYTLLVSALVLSVLYTFYYYLFSHDPAALRRNMLTLGIVSAIVPVITWFAIKKYEYSEFKIKVAQQRLKRTHDRQLWQLARLETETVLMVEEKAVAALKALDEQDEYKALAEFKQLVSTLIDRHSQQSSATMLNEKLKAQVVHIGEKMPKAYQNYPELERIYEEAKRLASVVEGDEGGLIECAGNFMDSVKDVAKDKVLISVLMNSEEGLAYYNACVDVYLFFEQLFQTKKQVEQEASKTEQRLVELFESTFSGTDFVDAHKEKAQFVSAYNRLVDLYTHCKKKSES